MMAAITTIQSPSTPPFAYAMYQQVNVAQQRCRLAVMYCDFALRTLFYWPPPSVVLGPYLRATGAMAIFSKYYYQQSAGKICADFTHPGVTCEHFAFTTFRDGWIGGSQYYLPSIVLPALLKWDKWSIPFWGQVFKDYVRSIFFGASMMIFVGYGSFCYFYKFVQQHHNIFVFLPCALGSLFGYFMPSQVLEIQSIGALNMALDYVLRGSRSSVVQFLRRSTVFNTLLFMVSSGFINRVVCRGLVRRYWFLKSEPNPPTSPNRECVEKDNSKWMNTVLRREFKVCSHAESCDNFILSQVRRTAGFSFLLALANFLASQSKSLKGNWSKFPIIFYKHFDFGLFFFLTSYNGIYRFLYCLLNRQSNEDTIQNSTIAATLSGATFVIYKRYLILAFACIRAVQLSCMERIEKYKETSELYKTLDKIPFQWIIYTVATAFAYQARVFYPDICPTYVHQIMTIGTGRRSDTLSENYAAILMGLK